MRIPRASAAFAVLFLVACGDDGGSGGAGGSSSTSSGDGGTSASTPDAGAGGDVGSGGGTCDEPGKPEMTGPIQGLEESYAAGDAIDVGVPVDEDTKRVIVGIYEVGSALYLGGTAEDTSGPTTQALSFFAGVEDGEVGEFYLAIELCSTSVCTTPFTRNTYQRSDRTAAALAAGETYTQTREYVGGDGTPNVCPTDIPIQGFFIE